MTVITRFAPSPTGMLHIGGARTALFNYLFAKHTGGKFLLRVEDTDMARNSDAAYKAILDAMAWLGLPHDGDIVYQSTRAARHREVAEELVKRGNAYYCYTTPEELEKFRHDHPNQKFRSPWRRDDHLPPPTGEGWGGGSTGSKASGGAASTARGGAAGGAVSISPPPNLPPLGGGTTLTPPAGVQPSIRIKAPLTGEIIVRDAVQGEVHFGAADALDDMVILRSDGTPTYMLAVVVDDHDMGVTHIIRGDDHLNNAGRQMMIYQAMGWNVPVFAHIPLIHGPDGAKLSKRHGATSTTEYANMGYLPEAMRNYLARLGWAHGDDEIFSDAQAAEWFTLEHIGQAPARLDFAKLNHVNAHYMRAKPNAELAALIAPALNANEAQQALLTRAMDGLKPRASTLVELAAAAKFYLAAQPLDEKAADILARGGRELLAQLIPHFEALSDWTHDPIMATAKAFGESIGKKLGDVMGPVRAAITGTTASPSMFEALAVLGRDESLKRLKAAAQA
jgi:glutamyl-tRNA synthetase